MEEEVGQKHFSVSNREARVALASVALIMVVLIVMFLIELN